MKKFFVVFVLVFLGVISYIPNASAAGNNNWVMIKEVVGQNRRDQIFVNVFHRESNYVRVAICTRMLRADGSRIGDHTLLYDFLKNKPACRRLEEYIDNNGKEYIRPKGTGEWLRELEESVIEASQWLHKKKYINWEWQKPY